MNNTLFNVTAAPAPVTSWDFFVNNIFWPYIKLFLYFVEGWIMLIANVLLLIPIIRYPALYRKKEWLRVQLVSSTDIHQRLLNAPTHQFGCTHPPRVHHNGRASVGRCAKRRCAHRALEPPLFVEN
jgi:hypothetical protein